MAHRTVGSGHLMCADPQRALTGQRAAKSGTLLLFSLLLCGSGSAGTAAPEQSVSIGGSRESLTMIAEDVSLRDALEYIAHHQQLAVESYVSLHERITLEIIEQPLKAVLCRLLRDYSFTLLLSGEEMKHSRLWIYPRDAAITQPLSQPQRFGVAAVKTVKR